MQLYSKHRERLKARIQRLECTYVYGATERKWKSNSIRCAQVELENLERCIEVNVKIAKSTSDKRRIEAVVYRLYKTCGCSPSEIGEMLGLKSYRIQLIIGKIFKSLCKKDSECVFKAFF